MAERRMFAKTIIDSDAFLEMPATAQLLYFHMTMRGDDEGFINNPKSIMRNVGCKDDDMTLLIAKGFVIPFETGIVVIRHWRIHNYIQKDRFHETKCVNEKSLLVLDENNAYSRLDTECIQDVSKMDTQVRLGKVSLGKDSLNNTFPSAEENEPENPPIPLPEDTPEPKKANINYKAIQEQFNSICKSFSQVQVVSDSRKRSIKKLVDKFGLETLEKVFRMAEASDFLTGNTKEKWRASFDWIITESNFIKILEGNYDNKKPIVKEKKGNKTDYSQIYKKQATSSG